MRKKNTSTAQKKRRHPVDRKFREIPATGGRILRATPVFDTYWKFAVARQQIFHKRVRGEEPPWTNDPVLSSYRFTNAYRASDRVSQFLIRNVLYSGSQDPDEIVFRCLLFKIFNRIETWNHLTEKFGPISWSTFSYKRYAASLDSLFKKSTVYSAAYIMPSPRMGAQRKHRNHLMLLESMIRNGLPQKIAKAPSLESVYHSILSYPSIGPFLAFQFAIDLNYSSCCNFSEMDFVVAGPGARSGIRKCFVDSAGFSEAEIIEIVAKRASEEFARQGLRFEDLWGRRLQLIDCQNLFCEVDKYARVVHPEWSGPSARTRIKQKFTARARPTPQWYPPKWGLITRRMSRSDKPPVRGGQVSLPI